MATREPQQVLDFMANMRPEELGLMFALLGNAADADAACALADYLEDDGRHEAGARIRRLVPQSGDVLVFTVPGDDADGRVADAVNFTSARLQAHGWRVTCLVLLEGCTLARVGEDAMRAAGWVRQERVAEAVAAEREACARLVEDVEYPRAPYPTALRHILAVVIRAREANDHIDEVRETLEGWPASAGFAPGGVAWDTPATSTPVADIGRVAEQARRHGTPFGGDAPVGADR